MTRRRIVVDCESSGLDPAVHEPVEVAWHDLTTGDHGRFVPQHDLIGADEDALAINGYFRRGLDQEPQDDGAEVGRLHTALRGQTLAGSNPRFDAAMLTVAFVRYGLDEEPWHHRLDDLAARAAQELGLDDLPGLATVCDLLGVRAPDHSAAGDVRATVECFRKLAARQFIHTASGRRGRVISPHRRFGVAGAWVLWNGQQRPTWHPRAVLREES